MSCGPTRTSTTSQCATSSPRNSQHIVLLVNHYYITTRIKFPKMIVSEYLLKILTMAEECEEGLSVLFKSIDSNKNGLVDAKELLMVCHQNNIQITESLAVRMLTQPDKTVEFNMAKFCELLKNCPSTKSADIIYFLLQLYDEGISTATIPTTTSTTTPGAWRQKTEADCWYKCGSKDGSCPTFCGVGGFCCRKGYSGCPAGAPEASPKYHTCVIQIGTTTTTVAATSSTTTITTPTKTACKADEKISGNACLCQGTSCDIGGICTGGNACTPGLQPSIHSAKPYSFEYAVTDHNSNTNFFAAESRVAGSHSVMLPDGRTQHVSNVDNKSNRDCGITKEVTLFGDATFFQESWVHGKTGACGFEKPFSALAEGFFTAVGTEDWDDGFACGTCVEVGYKGRKVIVNVVDRCGACTKGWFDLGGPAWTALTGEEPGRARQVTSKWVECPRTSKWVECPRNLTGGQNIHILGTQDSRSVLSRVAESVAVL